MTTIRFLLCLAVKYNFDIYHFDVETAFLYSDLDEDIYVIQPEPFVNTKEPHKVLKLHSAIYGLKQGSKKWHDKLKEILTQFGLTQCKTDPCFFICNNNQHFLLIAVYVDDEFVITNSETLKQNLIDHLRDKLTIKDLGKLSNFLNIKVNYDQDKGKLSISQESYINQVLKRFNMANCSSVTTPLDPNQKLSAKRESSSSPEAEFFPYQETVGSLLYLGHVSRPDICFPACNLNTYSNDFSSMHVKAVKRVLRYLQGSKNLKLEFTKEGNPQVIGYCDADWGSDERDRKSIGGYVFVLQGAAISWSSKKQRTTALSSCEAEYMSLAAAVQEAMWLRKMINGIDPSYIKGPTMIYMDNQAAIRVAETQDFKDRLRHIDIKYYFIGDAIEQKLVDIQYVNTNDMPADFLTKPLFSEKFVSCARKVGLK